MSQKFLKFNLDWLTSIRHPKKLIGLIGLGLAFLSYWLVLSLHPTANFGFALRYTDLMIMLPATGIFYLIFRVSARWAYVIGCSAALALFALTLAGVWGTNISNSMILGSLVPQTDASAYVNWARKLLSGQPTTLGYLRPFAPGLLAVLLAVTQQNLQASIAILVAIVAIACFTVAWEVRNTHGALAGAIVLVGLFIFYRSFMGTVMTESLGLAFGCLGFAALWKGIAHQRQSIALAGYFLLTFGMITRLGAVLILPFLLLWGTFIFARRSERFSISFLMSGAAVLLSGLLINSLLSNYLAAGEYVSFGNYAYTLYGILTGGNWLSFYRDYPDIAANKQLLGEDKIAQVYAICFQIIYENPLALVQGILHSVGYLFKQGLRLLFTDIPVAYRFPSTALESAIKYYFYPMMALGIFGCLRFWRNPLHSFVLVCIIAVIASSALVPVWDTGLRAYAVTVVLGYILLAIGIYFSFRLLIWLLSKNPILSIRGLSRVLSSAFPDTTSPSPNLHNSTHAINQPIGFPGFFAVGFGLVLVALSSLGPAYFKATIPARQIQSAACPAGEQALVFYYHPNSLIHLIPDNARSENRVPHVRIGDFKRFLWAYDLSPRKAFLDYLLSLDAGVSITNQTPASIVVADTKDLPKEPDYYTGCGYFTVPVITPLTKNAWYVFRVNSIKPATQVLISRV